MSNEGGMPKSLTTFAQLSCRQYSAHVNMNNIILHRQLCVSIDHIRELAVFAEIQAAEKCIIRVASAAEKAVRA